MNHLARRLKQLESIPKDWLLTQAPADLNVLNIASVSGLLSPRELEITDTEDIEVLLSNLAGSVWSSHEVTLAFYKRAIIAHQLVRRKLTLKTFKFLLTIKMRLRPTA